MRSYYRVMLGARSVHAGECFAGGFIGTDYDIPENLTGKLPEHLRDFNKRFIPVFLSVFPNKTKIGAGLGCGSIWVVCKGIKIGDIVLCPDGSGQYRVGEMAGDYYCAPGQNLPHRRNVRWLDIAIPRTAMSEALRGSTGIPGTVSDITPYHAEIERLLGVMVPPVPALQVVGDVEVEDPLAFAMEKHLEDFLVANWDQTLLGKDFVIYTEDGELVGQQYRTDAGPIDVLAVSRDRTRLLVVELKRGRASDVVLGQVLRYMGYVRDQIAEDDQTVEGVIIALDDDQKLRWALIPVPSISFYRYQVSFKLVKG